MVAFVMDAAVMCAGFLFAKKFADRIGSTNSMKKLPKPDVMLIVSAVDDSTGETYSGAAMYGQDGNWYWTMDMVKTKVIPYRVYEWWYMDK